MTWWDQGKQRQSNAPKQKDCGSGGWAQKGFTAGIHLIIFLLDETVIACVRCSCWPGGLQECWLHMNRMLRWTQREGSPRQGGRDQSYSLYLPPPELSPLAWLTVP